MKEKRLRHFGIIPDGNRRYAKKKGISFAKAYEKGALTIKKAAEFLAKNGVEELSVYIISKLNLGRGKEEIKTLEKVIKGFMKELDRENTSLLRNAKKKGVVADLQPKGDLSLLPRSLRKTIDRALRKYLKRRKELERERPDLNKIKVNLLVAYDGQDEIIRTVNTVLKKRRGKKGKITVKEFEKNLDISSYPELVFRTGGFKRLSGFLSYQSAYSELYFIKKLWPEVIEKDLQKALNFFYKTKRKFGK